MAGSILTPISIWNGFKLNSDFNATVAEETVKDGVIVSRFFINGKVSGGEITRILCVSARSEKLSLLPCVYVLPDFDRDIDEDFLIDMAKRGYYAFSTDFSGKKDDKEFFTVYPEIVNYANYENSKDVLGVIEDDFLSTPWYEWDCVAKYALSYLFTLSFVTGVGAVGVSDGASVLWHVAAGEDRLSCTAFLFDAGWNAYFNKGNYKFDFYTPEFSDNDLKYLAGVDAQAYAAFVKSPSLILSATNSDRFDFDRAFDTLSRLNKSVYSAADYSVNADNVLDYSAYKDLTVFLDEILLKGSKPELVLPDIPEVECYTENGETEIEVDAFKNGLKKVALYVSEGKIKQTLRCWKKFSEIEADELCDGQFFFKYLPADASDAVLFFVRATYENGFTVASNVFYKELTPKTDYETNKSRVVYSVREVNGESVFSPFYKEDYKHFIDKSRKITVEKGPMDIFGLKSENGFITYKINSVTDKPAPDAIMLIDVFAKTDAEIIISLVAADKKEYSYVISSPATKTWRNHKIALNKFKAEDGYTLKNYSSVVKVKIVGNGEYLINNFLWI